MNRKKYIINRMYIFLCLSAVTFSSNIDTMKNQIKKIESEISTKNTRIKVIGSEKLSLEKEIENTGQEIIEIQKEREKILLEIKKVERAIDYGEKNLNLTSVEKERVRGDILDKLSQWNRFQITQGGINIDPHIKYSFSRSINESNKKIEKIEEVNIEISKAKSEVEKEKKQLENLRYQALLNSKKLDSKIKQHESLIVKLNSERSSHESAIKKLQAEKARMEKEIQRIISERAKINKNVNYATALKQIGKLQRPIKGRTVTKFNAKKNGVASNGIEIRGELGSQVTAATGGKVIYYDEFQGLGKVVMIEYGYNLIGLYGNLISAQVKVGQTVKKGQSIGILGFSVESQPDLYYELRFKLQAVNPESFF